MSIEKSFNVLQGICIYMGADIGQHHVSGKVVYRKSCYLTYPAQTKEH